MTTAVFIVVADVSAAAADVQSVHSGFVSY